jgi:hypothetical protein
MADNDFNFTLDGFTTPSQPSNYLFDFGGTSPYYSFEALPVPPEPPTPPLFNFDFVSSYTPPEEYNFEFGWASYNIIKGFSNDFVAIWADPRASMSTGKFYVSSQDVFSVVNISTSLVIDYYNTTHSGLRGEVLTSSGVVDLYIQGE